MLDSVQKFSVFPEYFIVLSIVYLLIVITLITYNSTGLILQKGISECIALILLMTCYLILNDDLIYSLKHLDSFSFNSSIINDFLSVISRFLIAFFASIYFLFIADSLKEQRLTAFEYLIILLFAILGLMLMCCSGDLIIAYLSIELCGVAFYVLASFRKTSSYSVEAGIKYFITGAISSAFFLLGSSFIYGVSGSLNFYYLYLLGVLVDDYIIFYDIVNHHLEYATLFNASKFSTCLNDSQGKTLIAAILLSNYTIAQELTFGLYQNKYAPGLLTNIVELGLTLIYFSLFIKLALVPFHLWSLDVYEGSPTSSTIFFAIITKLSVFVLLIRLFHCFFMLRDTSWYPFLLCIGILSIFVGSFGGLIQRKLKTLFAYSSINNMGYLLLILCFKSKETYSGFFFYITIYIISGLCMWSIFLFLRLRQKSNRLKYNKELADLALLKKSNNPMAFALSLTMFSIAGIPPLIGFIAKFNIFYALITYEMYLEALFIILCSVISTFYYIRIIKVLYFENVLVGKLYYPITSGKTLLLSSLVLLLIFLFIYPNLLTNISVTFAKLCYPNIYPWMVGSFNDYSMEEIMAAKQEYLTLKEHLNFFGITEEMILESYQRHNP